MSKVVEHVFVDSEEQRLTVPVIDRSFCKLDRVLKGLLL